MRFLAEEYMASDEHFSSFWWSEKAIPAVSLNPPTLDNWFHVNHSSTFWQHENISSSVMRPSDQGYLAFIDLLFSTLAA
jgi:hypothetical protein